MRSFDPPTIATPLPSAAWPTDLHEPFGARQPRARPRISLRLAISGLLHLALLVLVVLLAKHKPPEEAAESPSFQMVIGPGHPESLPEQSATSEAPPAATAPPPSAPQAAPQPVSRPAPAPAVPQPPPSSAAAPRTAPPPTMQPP